MSLKTAVYAVGSVVAIHIIATIFNLYYTIGTLDIFMHFSGGVVMAMLALSLVYKAGLAFEPRHPKWFDFLFTLGFVMIAAVVWDLWEFAADQMLKDRYPLGYNQISIKDTMGDLFMGGLGGTMSYLFFNKR